jgi:hypothetical protein
MHTVNSFIGIVFSMTRDEINSRAISLQSLGTVPLEKRFRVMRMQAKSHRTMATILKTMSPDQSAKMKDAHEEARKRRLEYGKTVEKCDRNTQYFATNRKY